MPSPALRVLVAGAGVAGLELALALHDLAGTGVELTLLESAPDFVYLPTTVAEPFGGSSTRRPVASLLPAGARLVVDRLAAVDVAAHEVVTEAGRTLGYDVLVLATGTATRPAYARATTFDPLEPQTLDPIVAAIAAGSVRRVVVVVPPGPHWTLPAYELALLVAAHARRHGRDVATTVVVPEHQALAVFGHRVSSGVAALLRDAGVGLEADSFPEVRDGPPLSVVVHPRGRSIEADVVLALPRLVPRAVPGVGDGFLDVDGFGRVRGLQDVYAVGDATSFPVKQGGLAAQQADAAAAHIAARAGADVRPAPFRPVLRGRLLHPGGDRWLRDAAEGEIADHALWWPPAKLAGAHLVRALGAHDGVTAQMLREPPPGEDVEVLVPASGGPSVVR